LHNTPQIINEKQSNTSFKLSTVVAKVSEENFEKGDELSRLYSIILLIKNRFAGLLRTTTILPSPIDHLLININCSFRSNASKAINNELPF
jgi:hypothetical protein